MTQITVTLLKSKVHRATVTECHLDYDGSISIDRDIMDASGLLPHEQVDVYNINNGARFTTYVIEGERGTSAIGLNGAAARLAVPGDKIIICAYCGLPQEEARNYAPTVIVMDDDNRIARR